MRRYTWDEYYDKFFDWAESTRIKNLSYLDSLGDSDEVTEVIIELKENRNAANRLLRRAIDEKFKFSGENLGDLFFWDFDKKIVMKALRNSADRLTTEDIEELYITVDDEILLEICQKAGIPLPEDLKEDLPDNYSTESYKEVRKMSRAELREAYDFVLQCLYSAHEKMILALKLSISDMNSSKRPISIAKHACLVEAEGFVNKARVMLGEIESQIQDKVSVQNTRLNMGKCIMFHDVYGDGFLTDWMVQRRIRKMIKAVEDAHKEVQKLRENL